MSLRALVLRIAIAPPCAVHVMIDLLTVYIHCRRQAVDIDMSWAKDPHYTTASTMLSAFYKVIADVLLLLVQAIASQDMLRTHHCQKEARASKIQMPSSMHAVRAACSTSRSASATNLMQSGSSSSGVVGQEDQCRAVTIAY